MLDSLFLFTQVPFNKAFSASGTCAITSLYWFGGQIFASVSPRDLNVKPADSVSCGIQEFSVCQKTHKIIGYEERLRMADIVSLLMLPSTPYHQRN